MIISYLSIFLKFNFFFKSIFILKKKMLKKCNLISLLKFECNWLRCCLNDCRWRILWTAGRKTRFRSAVRSGIDGVSVNWPTNCPVRTSLWPTVATSRANITPPIRTLLRRAMTLPSTSPTSRRPPVPS